MPNLPLSSKRMRRDYSRKSFSNPLFSKRRDSERHPRWRRRIIWAAGLAAVCGWTWFIAFSPNVRVTDIQIRGVQNLAEWEVRDTVTEVLKKRRWLVFPQSSLFILPETAVEKALNDRYALESVHVTKAPPHTLVVELRERPSTVVLQLPDGGQALIGLDGQVTRTLQAAEALDVVPKLGPVKSEAAAPRPPAYPVVYDDRQELFKLRAHAMRPEIVRTTIGLAKAFADVFRNDLLPGEIHLDGAGAQTLRTVTSEGWSIYLDGESDTAAQLADAETVLKEKIGADRRRLEYIDARFGEKIFFKLRN